MTNPILVSLLPPRRKYLHGLGSVEEVAALFSAIIDVSPITAADEYHVGHADTLNEEALGIPISAVFDFGQLVDALQNSEADYALVYATRRRSGTEEVLSAVDAAVFSWGIAATKMSTLSYSKVLNPSRQVQARIRRSARFRLNPGPLVADHIFTNSSLNALAELQGTSVTWRKRIRVRHLDAYAAPKPDSRASRTGVFIDQGLPWNPEARDADGQPLWADQPENYTSALNGYLNYARDQWELDDVILALHPNVQHSPPWLDSARVVTGVTRSVIAAATHVFGHFSQALAIAVQAGAVVTAVEFVPGFSRVASANVVACARALGVEREVWDGKSITERVVPSRYRRLLQGALVRKYHAPAAPNVCTALRVELQKQ